MTDIDGNVYKTIQIGTQTWMAENLKTTRYNDGSAIPDITDNNTWAGLTTGAYCFYNNDQTNNATYGKLYNWYAVNTDKLAPTGWHVPTDQEWSILISYLGGTSSAGGKMKSTILWNSPNTNANNLSGFSAIPTGERSTDGTYNYIGQSETFWSLNARDNGAAWYCILNYSNSNAGITYYNNKVGFSIRCVKN